MVYRFWDISSNWTFLTLKITFRVIPHLSYLGQDWLPNTEATWCNKFEQHCFYWIISIIMGKLGKPDLYDLENNLQNNSMKSIFEWQLINIIPKSLLRNVIRQFFLENCQKVSKYPYFPFSDLSDLARWPLERFNQIHILTDCQHSPSEASCQNRKQSYQTVFE